MKKEEITYQLTLHLHDIGMHSSEVATYEFYSEESITEKLFDLYEKGLLDDTKDNLRVEFVLRYSILGDSFESGPMHNKEPYFQDDYYNY